MRGKKIVLTIIIIKEENKQSNYITTRSFVGKGILTNRKKPQTKQKQSRLSFETEDL